MSCHFIAYTVFQSCELLENRPQTNEGLEKGMNFMMRDVTENSEESKKCCRPRRDGSQIENFRKSQRTKTKVMVLLELATKARRSRWQY